MSTTQSSQAPSNMRTASSQQERQAPASVEMPMSNNNLDQNTGTIAAAGSPTSAFHVPPRASSTAPRSQQVTIDAALTAGLAGLTPELVQALLMATKNISFPPQQPQLCTFPITTTNNNNNTPLDLLAIARSLGINLPPVPAAAPAPVDPNNLSTLLESHMSQLPLSTLLTMIQQGGGIPGLANNNTNMNPSLLTQATTTRKNSIVGGVGTVSPPQSKQISPPKDKIPTTVWSNTESDTKVEVSSSSSSASARYPIVPGMNGTIILPCRARGMPVEHNFRVSTRLRSLS